MLPLDDALAQTHTPFMPESDDDAIPELVEHPIGPELDLHTFRPGEVSSLLPEYFAECRKRGLLRVRIIHGKGLGSVNKTPVLKNKVRNWLVQKNEVIAFCQARAADGGSGALMVLLKG